MKNTTTFSISQEPKFLEVALLSQNLGQLSKWEKGIFWLLYNMSHVFDAVFPSRESIAASVLCGLHIKAVSEATNKLQELGLLKKTQRFNKSNLYEIHPYLNTKEGKKLMNKIKYFATFSLSFLFVSAPSKCSSDRRVTLNKGIYIRAEDDRPEIVDVSVLKQQFNSRHARWGGYAEWHESDDEQPPSPVLFIKQQQFAGMPKTFGQARSEDMQLQDLLIDEESAMQCVSPEIAAIFDAPIVTPRKIDGSDEMSDEQYQFIFGLPKQEARFITKNLLYYQLKQLEMSQSDAAFHTLDAIFGDGTPLPWDNEANYQYEKREWSMEAFTEEQLVELTIYSKEILQKAQRRITQELLAGKTINNHFAYFKAICDGEVNQLHKREGSKTRASVASRPVVEYQEEVRPVVDSRELYRNGLRNKHNPFMAILNTGFRERVVIEHGAQVAKEIEQEFT